MKPLLALLIAAMAQAQTGNVDGPVLGYVVDARGSVVRPLGGIPASAALGAPMTAASGLHGITLAGRRGYVLGIDNAAGAGIVDAVRGIAPLAVALPGISRVYVSSGGAAAAAYRPDAGKLDIFTGMPDQARLSRSVSIDAPPADLALSEDGSAIAMLARSRRGFDTVSWIDAGGNVTTLYHARRIESIALLDGSTAIVAEPQSVKLLSPAFGAQTLADGLEGVVAAAASADGARIVIAMQSGRVDVLDRASGVRATVSCSCAPSGLAPLRGNTVFRLNEPDGGPLWILDADGPEPRILFAADRQGGVQ